MENTHVSGFENDQANVEQYADDDYTEGSLSIASGWVYKYMRPTISIIDQNK